MWLTGGVRSGTCADCNESGTHKSCLDRCGRLLRCGHACEAECSSACPPCPQKCLNGCLHGPCPSKCADTCEPCQKPCTWRCRHFQCDLLCHQLCTRPRCNRRCNRQLQNCKHRCAGLCGEPCPDKCRICDGDTMDTLLKVAFKDLDKQDRLIMLIDCKHVFAVSGLDSWMDLGRNHDHDAEVTAEASASTLRLKLKEWYAYLLPTCPDRMLAIDSIPCSTSKQLTGSQVLLLNAWTQSHMQDTRKASSPVFQCCQTLASADRGTEEAS